MQLNLPRERFFKKADFELLFKTGKRKYGEFFIVYFRPIEVAEQHVTKQMGLVVSKKATKTNVRRNLVKRLIRESYRVRQHGLMHLQILVVAKKDIKKADRAAFKSDLNQLWQHFL